VRLPFWVSLQEADRVMMLGSRLRELNIECLDRESSAGKRACRPAK